MPVSGWNGKFQAVGNGGWAGSITYGAPSRSLADALEQWVEQGRTPDRIIASLVSDGKVVRTRPLCPYPQVAHYTGMGSTDDASNFVCRVP